MINRKITSVYLPTLKQGFLGPGHTARGLLEPMNYKQTNPFILLMEDTIKVSGGEPVGGAHPHAGFETATLTVYNNLSGENKTGTFELLTAGSGVIHTETTYEPVDMQILQLWLVLPKKNRSAEPLHQDIGLQTVPTKAIGASSIRVYSGSSNGITSPIQNQTPLILVDVEMVANSTINHDLPSSYTSFFVVLDGKVAVGDKTVKKGEVAWLDKSSDEEESHISFTTGESSARFILYAGEPQEESIVSYGPFIADTEDDIKRLRYEYGHGKFPHLNDLDASRVKKY